MRGDGCGSVSGLPHLGPHPSHQDCDQGDPGACLDGADTMPSHMVSEVHLTEINFSRSGNNIKICYIDELFSNYVLCAPSDPMGP